MSDFYTFCAFWSWKTYFSYTGLFFSRSSFHVHHQQQHRQSQGSDSEWPEGLVFPFVSLLLWRKSLCDKLYSRWLLFLAQTLHKLTITNGQVCLILHAANKMVSTWCRGCLASFLQFKFRFLSGRPFVIRTTIMASLIACPSRSYWKCTSTIRRWDWFT